MNRLSGPLTIGHFNLTRSLSAVRSMLSQAGCEWVARMRSNKRRSVMLTSVKPRRQSRQIELVRFDAVLVALVLAAGKHVCIETEIP